MDRPDSKSIEAREKWRLIKSARARMIGGWFCEVCGKELDENSARGHHIAHTRWGGRDELKNCMLRCYNCERVEDTHFVTRATLKEWHDKGLISTKYYLAGKNRLRTKNRLKGRGLC